MALDVATAMVRLANYELRELDPIRLLDLDLDSLIEVRGPQAFVGMLHRPGTFSMERTGQVVIYESQQERGHLMKLDRERDVTFVLAQPLQVQWRDERGKLRGHVPDFLVQRRSGRIELLDITSNPLRAPFQRNAYAATRRLCQALRWEHRVLLPVQAEERAVLDALAGMRFWSPDLLTCAPAILAALESGTRVTSDVLADAQRTTGAPMVVLTGVLLHLIWHGAVLAEDKQVSGREPVPDDDSVVCLGNPADRRLWRGRLLTRVTLVGRPGRTW